ncbi:hypothetical protein [Alterisphingorhabdus coralli]|uniref:Uncharacterized protein n=1 Tax=Alterisphingorhabdus coralli TaxID=3071408 RepID=A0AA97F7I7_9SPHN|nr:hypothetical protein [Parasphingorhabdus sp. SCSIO 66989]WOE73960.1 hypothetical protein RB602_08790 [Parasphingorhabdus sp. SCSIO 66989]
MHPVNWITIIVGVVVIGSYFDLLLGVDLPKRDYIGIPLVMLLGCLIIFIAVYPECLYRISYDDDAIYMRPPWFTWELRPKPFVRLPFDHIGLVTGERAPINQLFYGSNTFTPFQHATVYPSIWPEDWDADQVFLLTGAQLKDQEFRDLLWLINEKAPGTLDENVIAFLESERRF